MRANFMNKKKLIQSRRVQLKIMKNLDKMIWKENNRMRRRMIKRRTIKMTQIYIIKQLAMKLYTMIQLSIFGRVFRLALIK